MINSDLKNIICVFSYLMFITWSQNSVILTCEKYVRIILLPMIMFFRFKKDHNDVKYILLSRLRQKKINKVCL